MEKEMATHFSVLAWRIPGTGEPGGLSSLGCLRVGHDWSDLAAAVFYTCNYEVSRELFWLLKIILFFQIQSLCGASKHLLLVKVLFSAQWSQHLNLHQHSCGSDSSALVHKAWDLRQTGSFAMTIWLIVKEDLLLINQVVVEAVEEVLWTGL